MRETAEALLCAAEDNPAAIEVPEIQRRRVARDQAWTAHRVALDRETADRFEAAMRADDSATAAHAEGADARARLQTRRDEVARATAAEAIAARALSQAEERAAIVAEEAKAVAERLLLGERAPLEALSAQRRHLAAALDAAQKADSARNVLSRGERRYKDLAGMLAGALEAAGGALDGARLVVAARHHLAELRDVAAARERWQDRDRQIGQFTRRVKEAEARRETSRADVQKIVAKSWAAEHKPEALKNVLPEARKLGQRMKDLRDVDHRISRMEDALAIFDQAAERPRMILGSEASSAELMRDARERHAAAEKLAMEIADETQRLRDAEEAERSAREEQVQAAEQIEVLLAGQAPQGEEGHIAFVERLGQRDELRSELNRLDREISEVGTGLDPDRLAEEEGQTDPARLPGLRDAVDLAERHRDEAGRLLGAAEQELRAALEASCAASSDQERAAILEELHAGARDSAARMIGLAAARAALRRLGESRRGPMLREAETAFRRLTGGAWTRLETWTEGRDERLVGVADSRAVPADRMSTGTRAQLYLALRIAGHAAFVREAGPLPFVTDDILESFDDDRAAAALDLTAELGRRGQAILFTHHAHLVEMAQERIRGVRILEMPQRQAVEAYG